MFRFLDHLLIFIACAIFCEGDWVQIMQRQERSSPKPQTSGTNYYNSSRNEYVFITTPSSALYEKVEEPPLDLSAATAFPTEEEFTSTIQELISENSTSTTSALDEIVPLVEDRIDRMDILDSVSTKFTTENSKGVIDETPNYWSTEKLGKARIVRVYDENTQKEKLRNVRTEGFIPFLKRVQDELITKSHKNLKGKISMLRKLRDDMLLNIDERINQLWGRKSSEARDHKEEDYDMHFPSNEGALMTIGFLTFAVFLIKLVLKLVQALKDKHNTMMVVPTMMTTANAALIGRRKRDASYDEQSKILQLIDEYSFT